MVGRLGFSGSKVKSGREQFLSNVLAFYYLITRRKDFLHSNLTTLQGERKTFPTLKQLSLKENGFVLVF